MKFCRTLGGDFIRAEHVLIVQPNAEDPRVGDDVTISATLLGGFGCSIRCGDLRRALDIDIDVDIERATRASKKAVKP